MFVSAKHKEHHAHTKYKKKAAALTFNCIHKLVYEPSWRGLSVHAPVILPPHEHDRATILHGNFELHVVGKHTSNINELVHKQVQFNTVITKLLLQWLKNTYVWEGTNGTICGLPSVAMHLTNLPK